jgi:outer membrane lipoprotein SlyB
LKENIMSATLEQVQATPPATKALWAAVGVLGVAAVAMGAALVHVKTQPADPSLGVVSTVQSLQANESVVPTGKAAVAPNAAAPTDEVPGESQSAVQKAIKQATQPVQTAQAPVKPAKSVVPPVKTVPAPSYSQTYPVQDMQRTSDHAAKPVCASCGTVESVSTVQREAKPSGVGVVAGGVLGAIVGNQIGKGSGRAVATVAGAVGGGWAGNAIEKNMKKTTVYQVHVRMEDGSLKTIEQASPAAVGARVTVDGGTLHPANDGAAAPAPERPTAVPVYTRG